MDINQLRADTPGTENVIHFNNAGASLMPAPVSEAVIAYLKEETARGGYETKRKYHQELEGIYPNIGRFINAKSDEIAIQENATAAWHMMFFAIDFEDGDRILTSMSEYASNYISYLKLQQQVDISIEIIPNDESGQTSTKALAGMMDEQVKLVSITHIPTNSGLVNPVEEIGQTIRKYPCLYLVDACQSVGQYPVDVQEIECDMLSATGRKFLRGPRGTGFLYADKQILPALTPPFLDLYGAKWTAKDQFETRDDARRFENWESNYAGIMGLNAAVGYAADIGLENIWNRIMKLSEYLRERLTDVDGLTVRDIGSVKGGIVTFTVREVKAETIQKKLSEHDINVSISGRSSTLLDMKKRNLERVVRASVHYYNTEEEIDTLVDVLRSMH